MLAEAFGKARYADHRAEGGLERLRRRGWHEQRAVLAADREGSAHDGRAVGKDDEALPVQPWPAESIAKPATRTTCRGGPVGKEPGDREAEPRPASRMR